MDLLKVLYPNNKNAPDKTGDFHVSTEEKVLAAFHNVFS